MNLFICCLFLLWEIFYTYLNRKKHADKGLSVNRQS